MGRLLSGKVQRLKSGCKGSADSRKLYGPPRAAVNAKTDGVYGREYFQKEIPGEDIAKKQGWTAS